ncbi:MAG: Naringenin-chalcone synthase, partial [uncultured Nocardioidaceae bacterium]
DRSAHRLRARAARSDGPGGAVGRLLPRPLRGRPAGPQRLAELRDRHPARCRQPGGGGHLGLGHCGAHAALPGRGDAARQGRGGRRVGRRRPGRPRRRAVHRGLVHRLRHTRPGHPAGPRPRHDRRGPAAARRPHGLLRGAARARGDRRLRHRSAAAGRHALPRADQPARPARLGDRPQRPADARGPAADGGARAVQRRCGGGGAGAGRDPAERTRQAGGGRRGGPHRHRDVRPHDLGRHRPRLQDGALAGGAGRAGPARPAGGAVAARPARPDRGGRRRLGRAPRRPQDRRGGGPGARFRGRLPPL